jgi:transposase
VKPERDVRVKRAQRGQITWGRGDLDAEVPADHEVRAIAAVIDKLDLRGLYADVRARGEIAGAPATDPKILLELWVYATRDGVGSGREIARLVELHAAYRWLCGGVAVAYHRLNDFRSDHGDVFSELVTQLLARLMKRDLIDLHRAPARHLPKPGDRDAVAAWRVRMGTDDAKQIYKQRAATAETVNADAKAHRGMAATALRGLDKVTSSACLFALTYNILRFITVSA